MINKSQNISSYFDEDFIKIIYKDLKINKVDNLEEILALKEKEKKDLEIHKFKGCDYEFGSVGYTSKELEKENIKFSETKLLSNDYLGKNASYTIAIIKILYSVDEHKILGFQIANAKNIDDRLEIMKKVIEAGGTLNDLAKVRVIETADVSELDLVNIAALMAINKIKGYVDLKEIEPIEIFDLQKNNAFLLDVREDYEFEVAHVKGAVNISLRELMQRIDELPKDTSIYVYCRSAHRSLDAVGFLNSVGFDNVYNVKEGFIGISFVEFYRDKGDLKNSILTNYNFD